MRFAVDTWDPDHGSPIEAGALQPSDAPTRIDVERDEVAWAPITPAAPSAPVVLFVDGVRRIEARVWVTEDDGSVALGIAASYGAGVVRCNAKADVVATEVERRFLTTAASATSIVTKHGTFGCITVPGDTPDALSLALQQQMGGLEVGVARDAARRAGDALIVVDGPLRQHGSLPGAVGSIKSQHSAYGPPVVQTTIARLAAGQRTPVFSVGDRFVRWSWYLRLPGPVPHPMASIVRCEASADLPTVAAVALADQVAATLPRYASAAHKDSRAPQNLYPIGGLERALRRRLGDQQLLLRALHSAAANADPTATAAASSTSAAPPLAPR